MCFSVFFSEAGYIWTLGSQLDVGGWYILKECCLVLLPLLLKRIEFYDNYYKNCIL